MEDWASTDVQSLYGTFSPQWLFIGTWDRVRYYSTDSPNEVGRYYAYNYIPAINSCTTAAYYSIYIRLYMLLFSNLFIMPRHTIPVDQKRRCKERNNNDDMCCVTFLISEIWFNMLCMMGLQGNML